MPKQKNRKFIVFGAPRIEKDEINEVVKTLKSGWIGTGPKTAKFEQILSSYAGAKYAIAVNSCTAALHLSMIAVGIGPGDEVIIPAMTFCATANAIIHTGAKPVFVDVKKSTMNIDPVFIEKAITKKTKAIIPVHFAGRPCEMDQILKIAKKHKLLIIEDAAHAIGAEYYNKKIGNIGDATCFSFYVTKNITTAEGGMIITNNKNFADKIKIYSLHGLTKDAWNRYSDEGYKHYQVVYSGFKYNMTDIQASLGIHQMKKIKKYQKIRDKYWKMYNEGLSGLPLTLPAPPEKNTIHAKHLYTILLDLDILKISRDEFMEKLYQKGIGTGVHYIALNLHPYYQKMLGYKKGDFPNAEYISERTVSLPFSPKLTPKDVNRILGKVKNILTEYKK